MAVGSVVVSLAIAWAPSGNGPQLRGMASRGVAPAPRAKASGLPVLEHVTDIAAEAGLTEPVIFGGEKRNDYILEVKGCGVAFLDFDNDGWQDILVLSGSR